mmetsp:Transcript_16872/g.43067  ORF Transcript_16872/g.43067 Transcript_16872/m.43067 type:complete len:458 (-) Transcript_16872:156-1529(-)
MSLVQGSGRFLWPLLLVVVPAWQVIPAYARGLAVALLFALLVGVVLFAWQVRRRALSAHTPTDRIRSLFSSLSVAILVGAVVFALYDLEVNFEERVDFEQFVHAAGLVPERHFVETEDGFVLALHRVLAHFNRTDPGALPRVPVLLQHGLMEDSSIWMMFGNRSLAFTLAMEGFDVWMGNSRGTVESQTHVRYGRDQTEYWRFSFEEMGKYDLSANLEYILATTGARRLVYIGQSQGGGQALVGLSLQPALQDRVQLLVLLAPGAFISPPSHPFIEFIYEWCAHGSFGDMEFVPYFYEFRTWLPRSVLSYFGEAIMRWMGFVQQPIDGELLSTLYIQTPSGSTSIRNLKHWAQLSQTGEYRQYDNGPEENLRQYGEHPPPRYPLDTIQTPISLFLGEVDNVIHFDRSREQIPHRVLTIGTNFSHADFVWSSVAPTLVHPTILDHIVASCLGKEPFNW